MEWNRKKNHVEMYRETERQRDRETERQNTPRYHFLEESCPNDNSHSIVQFKQCDLFWFINNEFIPFLRQFPSPVRCDYNIFHRVSLDPNLFPNMRLFGCKSGIVISTRVVVAFWEYKNCFLPSPKVWIFLPITGVLNSFSLQSLQEEKYLIGPGKCMFTFEWIRENPLNNSVKPSRDSERVHQQESHQLVVGATENQAAQEQGEGYMESVGTVVFVVSRQLFFSSSRNLSTHLRDSWILHLQFLWDHPNRFLNTEQEVDLHTLINISNLGILLDLRSHFSKFQIVELLLVPSPAKFVVTVQQLVMLMRWWFHVLHWNFSVQMTSEQ